VLHPLSGISAKMNANVNQLTCNDDDGEGDEINSATLVNKIAIEHLIFDKIFNSDYWVFQNQSIKSSISGKQLT